MSDIYKLEDALTFTKASDELLKTIKEHLPGKSEYNEIEIEGFKFEFRGECYSVTEIEEDDVISEGKYESGGTRYQLVKYDNTVCNYPCDENILEKYDVQIYITWYRTGSYYSDWYYSYDAPTIQRIKIVDVPEVIIPAHQEVKVEDIE